MSGKKLSMRTRAILLVSVFLLTMNVALGSVLMWQSRRAMKTQINERMLDIVNTAAAMLDGDVLEKLTAEDVGTPEYESVLNTLIRFRDNIKLDYMSVRHLRRSAILLCLDSHRRAQSPCCAAAERYPHPDSHL